MDRVLGKLKEALYLAVEHDLGGAAWENVDFRSAMEKLDSRSPHKATTLGDAAMSFSAGVATIALLKKKQVARPMFEEWMAENCPVFDIELHCKKLGHSAGHRWHVTLRGNRHDIGYGDTVKQAIGALCDKLPSWIGAMHEVEFAPERKRPPELTTKTSYEQAIEAQVAAAASRITFEEWVIANNLGLAVEIHWRGGRWEASCYDERRECAGHGETIKEAFGDLYAKLPGWQGEMYGVEFAEEAQDD